MHKTYIRRQWVALRCDNSVSYTHLDVYKRQAYNSKGYKHNLETIEKIKINFLQERRNLLAKLLANKE